MLTSLSALGHCEEWMEDSVCSKHYNKDIMYEDVTAAKALCQECPVLAQCMAWGDHSESDERGVFFPLSNIYGVVAGESPTERDARRSLRAH